MAVQRRSPGTSKSTPNRKTSEMELDQFNQQMRASPIHIQFLQSLGYGPGSKIKLSRGQQGELEQILKQNGIDIPGGMHIDNAGNLNQKNRLVRNSAIAAGAAAGGLIAAPAIAGALAGSSAPAAATAAGAVPSIGATGGLAAGAFPAIAGTTGASVLGGSAGALAPALAGGAKTVGASKGGSSVLGKIFGKGGLDPTALALGGLSMLGGDDPLGYQERKSYDGTSADPTQSLTDLYDAIKKMSGGIAARGPINLKNSVVPDSNFGPVSIPGVPFQIGGGLASDPALRDPSLLQGGPAPLDIFAGARSGTQQATKKTTSPNGSAVTRRRP